MVLIAAKTSRLAIPFFWRVATNFFRSPLWINVSFITTKNGKSNDSYKADHASNL